MQTKTDGGNYGHVMEVCEISIYETSKNLKCLKSAKTVKQTTTDHQILDLGADSWKHCDKNKKLEGHIKVAAYFSHGLQKNKTEGLRGK